MFLHLALRSLWSRKASVALTFLAITVSIFVLLGVEKIRHQAKSNFNNTVSGIDLIVGARTCDINLLLYSVFRLGNATSDISWQSYQRIASNSKVAWTIPLSLGDSHQGYRVMGTNKDYFAHFRYGRDNALSLAYGQPFADTFDVVLGSAVARELDYQIGDQLVLAHGLGQTSFVKHDDKPFRVAGILAPTGTPVDHTLHVSLAGIEAIHANWQPGAIGSKAPGDPGRGPTDTHPDAITAFMVGLKSKLATFQVQRQINSYRDEPLLAILPGVTMTQLWQMMAVMENTLRMISALVLLASLLGLAAMFLASIRERRAEIAVMRAIGASPWFIFCLLQLEALLITLASVVAAIALLGLGTALSADWLAARFSLVMDGPLLSAPSLHILLLVFTATVVVSTVPAALAYRFALKEQL